jgi:uncharacterized membrane protein
MLTTLNHIMLWFGAIACLLIGGVYFAFSTFVMTALGSMERPAAMAAMQAIDVVIQRSLFMPLFFGTTLVSLILAGIAILHWSAPGTRVIAVAAVIFLIGMFLVTALINVPMNNALAAQDPAQPEAVEFWRSYLQDWTFWNHVRTVASTAAGILYAISLVRIT